VQRFVLARFFKQHSRYFEKQTNQSRIYRESVITNIVQSISNISSSCVSVPLLRNDPSIRERWTPEDRAHSPIRLLNESNVAQSTFLIGLLGSLDATGAHYAEAPRFTATQGKYFAKVPERRDFSNVSVNIAPSCPSQRVVTCPWS